jgi:hypothetical protein
LVIVSLLVFQTFIDNLQNKGTKCLKIPKRVTRNRRMTHNTIAKWYERSNQKPCVEEWQTTQWPNDMKGVIRSRIPKKDGQYNGQMIPKGNQKPCVEEWQTTQWPNDMKGVIRSRMPKKDGQYNGQMISKG